MKVEQPWVYDGASLEDHIKTMVEAFNKESTPEEVIMEMTYLIGGLPEGYDVKLVFEKREGCAGTCLELESDLPYVGDFQ